MIRISTTYLSLESMYYDGSYSGSLVEDGQGRGCSPGAKGVIYIKQP